MRKLIVLLIFTFAICISSTVCSQIYELKYSTYNGPFKWKIKKIEHKDNYSFIDLTVENQSIYPEAIDLSQGEYAILSKDSQKGLKSLYNSLSDGKKRITLESGQELSFIIKFPSLLKFDSQKFNIKIGNYLLKNIKLPTLSLVDINKRMDTWEDFYNKRHKKIITYSSQDELKNAIKKEVENWQSKGEFESTSTWKQRVSEESRNRYFNEVSSRYLEQHQKEVYLAKLEQDSLANEYEKYKEDLLSDFYNHKIQIAVNRFKSEKFELKPYDADHETFLIHNNKYGDILLPVPLEEAPDFKENWEQIKSGIEPIFVPNGEDVALSKLIFTNNQNQYIYDSHTTANYAITDIKYNFTPLELSDFNIATIQTDDLTGVPITVSSKVVGITNTDYLTSKNPNVETVTVIASEKSTVDSDIPVNNIDKDSQTFAIIITNENYNSLSQVPFALHDGQILGKYLSKTVGLPEEHIRIYENASYGNILAAIKHIENLSQAFGEDLNLIFYYAGHGIPNEKDNTPLLIPIDGDPSIPETCYALDKIVSTLGSLNANQILILLDACFSGTERGNDMLLSSRGVRLKSKSSDPLGNMVIISASQGDETAFPYETEQHGLFTYFILKKLQESRGDVSLGELSEYIIEQVKRQSVVSKGKIQTPTIAISPKLSDTWRYVKFGR